MKQSFIILLFFIISLPGFAQKDGAVAFSGYKGNYIYNLFKPASAAHPDGDVTGFRIDRKANTGAEWTILSKFNTPSDYNELVKNSESAKSKVFDFRPNSAYTVNEIWPVYKQNFQFDSLGVYLTQQQIAMSFNLLLVDTAITSGVTYQYRVVQLKKDGSEGLKYTSIPVDPGAKINVNKPKALSRKVTSAVNQLVWTAKNTAQTPDALLINRREGTHDVFKRITPYYTIEIVGDSTIYTVTDDHIADETLYQYTITPVNRYGGLGGVVSDTLSAASLDQKLLIPKMFTAAEDTSARAIVLKWGLVKPEFISAVKIFRSESYDDGYTMIGTGMNEKYIDKTVTPGKKYYYYLTITDQLGRTSEKSTRIYGLMQLSRKPNAVFNLDVVTSTAGNTVNWQDFNLDTRGFYVYRTNELDGEKKLISGFILKASLKDGFYSFTDTAKITDALTGYAVITENLSNVNSDYSKLVYVKGKGKKPEAPVIIDLKQADKLVYIFWRNATGAPLSAGYNVYRKTGPADFVKVNKVSVVGSKTSYKDAITDPEVALSYKITSVDADGQESDFSEVFEIAGNQNIYPPSALKTAFTQDLSEVILQWQPSQSAVTTYEIFHYIRGAEPVKIGETKGNTLNYSDKTFDKESTNYYYIIAVAGDGKRSLPSGEQYVSVK